MNKPVDKPGALLARYGPPAPLYLAKRSNPLDRHLIEEAIAAGKVTVCSGYGEGKTEHYSDRFKGMTRAEYREALKIESIKKKRADQKFFKAKEKKGKDPAPKRPRGVGAGAALRQRSRAPAGRGEIAYGMRQGGAAWQDIASEVGLASQRSACKAARRHASCHNLPWPVEVPVKPQRTPWPEIAGRDQAIVEAARAGGHAVDIAKRFDMSRRRVGEIVKRDAPGLELPKRKAGRPRKAAPVAKAKKPIPQQHAMIERNREIVEATRAGIPQTKGNYIQRLIFRPEIPISQADRRDEDDGTESTGQGTPRRHQPDGIG